MLRTLRRDSLIGCAACSVLSLSAMAAEDTDLNMQSVLGGWQFQTEDYRDGYCTMHGTMFAYPNADLSGVECEFTAIENCGGEQSIVEQSCQVDESEGILAIKSTVTNMLEEKSWSIGYSPDDFYISSVKETEMRGELVSSVRASVVFRRMKGGMS